MDALKKLPLPAMEILTQYSLWWMLPVILVSALLTALLYYRNPRESFPLWANILFSFLRFSVFVILGFFFLNPMIKSLKSEVQKPIILFLQDDSHSIVLNSDSNYYRNDYPAEIEKLMTGLQEKYQLKAFSFASELGKSGDFEFKGETTNLSKALKSLYEQYAHLNIGALIVATDGIYNQGQNPYYVARSMKFPIYFIALGDTALHTDLMINRKAYKQTVFMGNKFPIEAEILLRKAKDKNTELQLIHDGKVIGRKKIAILSDNQKNTIRFYPEAKNAGLQEYRLRLKTIDGEQNTDNNYARLFVNVIEDRQKILLLYDSPHPDIAAIRDALEAHKTYEVEVIAFNEFRKNLKAYNLVILHQLPNINRVSFQLLQKVKNEHIPYLLILGSKTNLQYLNTLHLGIEIASRRMSTNTVRAIYNPDFGMFTISGDLQQSFNAFPPLQSPYGKYRVSKSYRSLLRQQIGNVKTDIPLAGLSNQSGRRSGFIAGEGIWRWRLHDYLQNKNHRQFDEFIGKMVRFLSLEKQHSQFDLQVKKQFEEGEEVRFDAILYNPSFEQVIEPEVEMKITDENGREYPYVFSKGDSAYFLNAGRFAPGIYRFEAKVKAFGKTMTAAGKFTVSSIGRESLDLRADYKLMEMIAGEHQAKFYDKSKMNELAADISSRKDIVSVEYNRLKYSELIEIKWIVVLLLLFLAIEWFVRKQMGSY